MLTLITRTNWFPSRREELATPYFNINIVYLLIELYLEYDEIQTINVKFQRSWQTHRRHV